MAIFAARYLAKAQIVIMISDQGILGSWNELSANRRQAPFQSQTAKLIQQKLLDAALENPATHQPSVDFENLLRHSSQQHADQPVIAESVGQRDRKC